MSFSVAPSHTISDLSWVAPDVATRELKATQISGRYQKKPAFAFQAIVGEVGMTGSGSNFFVEDLILPIDTLPDEMQQMVQQARAQGKDITFKTDHD